MVFLFWVYFLTCTWSYQVGIIDPAKKTVEVAPLKFDGDTAVTGWARDGKIVSVGFRYRMPLWRFGKSSMRER